MNLESCKQSFNDFFTDIETNILKDFPNESVMGITSDNRFVRFENIHEHPQEFFRINPTHFYDNDIKILIHSHTIIDGIALTTADGAWIDPRTPSKEDMTLQIALDIPFIIISTDGVECSDPIFFPDYESPLLGMPYINNVYDCWNLVMRFYHQEFGIKIEEYARGAGHWLKESENADIDVYKKYGDYGFVEVDDIEYGDLIMFRIKGSISHAGIYVGDDKFIHHINNRLSCTESLPRWRNRVWKIARHKDKL